MISINCGIFIQWEYYITLHYTSMGMGRWASTGSIMFNSQKISLKEKVTKTLWKVDGKYRQKNYFNI